MCSGQIASFYVLKPKGIALDDTIRAMLIAKGNPESMKIEMSSLSGGNLAGKQVGPAIYRIGKLHMHSYFLVEEI